LSKQGWLYYERADFADLVADAISPLQAMAQARDVTLASQTSPLSLAVDLDVRRVREAVQHLVHNAIKFTDAGGRITVRYGEDATDLVFEVEDTGKGIPDDDLANIWNRFSQLADPVRRGVEGLGVGLAMVKLIVEEHGGAVMARSQVGVGSTFGFRLPTRHAQGVAPAEIGASLAAPSEAQGE
jgi:signal transduction histidine kinase